ncbi:transcriptional regulator ManR [Halolactibacillus miurensis]|uniref:Transcriptional antiterminator n=2 Tax=Halolactibacillus miurensis TaxID=306541 RepID=A0A1I6SSP5_9BACI|nr:transcriptional regulator ManR [Halolactibacillus miurensis]SFS79879.1 Transcriptional antiterminator [Halolactibacillus miurensis]
MVEKESVYYNESVKGKGDMDMNKTDARRFHLYKLLAEELDYRPANFFSNQLSVSTKTIYDDVAFLNGAMDGTTCIEKMPRKGLLLKGSAQAKEIFEKKLIEQLSPRHLSFSPEERQREIVKRLFLQNEQMTYEQLSADYVVSASSLRKDMEEIQTFLTGKDVQLISDHFGTRHRGEEKDIQHVLKRYIFSLLDDAPLVDVVKRMSILEDLAEQFFNPTVIQFVHQVYGNLIAKAGRPLSDYYKDSLYISLLIYVQRLYIGCHTTKKKQVFIENVTYMESYLIAVELSEWMHHTLGLVLEKHDIEYLSSLLFAHDIKPVLEMQQAHPENVQIVKQLIKKMSHMLEVDLQHDSHLFHVLIAHMTTMIYRLKLGITLTNPLLESIKRQYSVLFNIVWYLMNDIEETYDIQLNDHDISFLTIHFQVSIEKKIPMNKILIVCEKALATSELIYNRIKHALPATNMIETISLSDFYQNNLDEVDLIISSVPLTYEKQPVIYVSPLVTESEMMCIKKQYDEMSQSKLILKPKQTKSETKLEKYLIKDNIFLHKAFKTKDQVLDFFSEEAYQRGLVTGEFRQSLYEREAMGETSLYTGVAIPHASSHTMRQSFISIVSLTHKIQWGSNKVQLIIFIGVAEKDINEIKDVFAELYQLIEKKSYVEHIVSMTDTSDLLMFINENTPV